MCTIRINRFLYLLKWTLFFTCILTFISEMVPINIIFNIPILLVCGYRENPAFRIWDPGFCMHILLTQGGILRPLQSCLEGNIYTEPPTPGSPSNEEPQLSPQRENYLWGTESCAGTGLQSGLQCDWRLQGQVCRVFVVKTITAIPSCC